MAIPKEIVHGLIPVRRSGQVAEFVITHSPEDRTPRLPGGGIESGETPFQAIRRELLEELHLDSEDIELTLCVAPEGISVACVSHSTGLWTHYRMTPFLVKLKPTGRAKLLRQMLSPLPQDPCRIWLETFDRWLNDGLGFERTYPQNLMTRLRTEQLNDFAVTWETD